MTLAFFVLTQYDTIR